MSRTTAAFIERRLASTALSDMPGSPIFILNVLGKKRWRNCREK